MSKKYKLTGFSRVLVFLIFFFPIALIGSYYIQGEDGLQKAKEFINEFKTEKSVDEKIADKENKIKQLELKIEALESEVKVLKEQ